MYFSFSVPLPLPPTATSLAYPFVDLDQFLHPTMQRLLSLKLIPHSPRNLHSIFPFKSNPHFSSPYATPSISHPNFPAKLTGFISNPVLAKRFLPNALFNGGAAGFIKAQFSRSYYGSRQSTPLERLRVQWRIWTSRTSPSNMLLGLIITNVAVFMLWRFADRDFMRKHFMVSMENIRNFSLHTLITSGFSHTDTTHLVFNMIGLYFFGSNIGRNFGSQFLLELYLKGAFVGSIFFLVHQKYLETSSKSNQSWGINHSKVSALGASGAVNAVILLDIFLFPTTMVLFDFFIPVPAALLGVFLIGNDVLNILKGDTQVSGAAHLGGAAVAALTWIKVRRGRF